MRKNPPCKRSEYWGQGGAGVLFTCSEDGTVLLLLRAEWVEQGGTWGIPGGGIGEGFYATPMEPITDLDVFRRKAQQEAEEECGALPPYMTRLPEGLPYTQYEDCGFRYVTFILDIPKATKDAWAPFSADGENDAFVWFPLAKVKRGRPLPDEHGDLHDIHFGVKFTMSNLPPRANPRRKNPHHPHPQTETPEFKAWFGNSKMLDEHGEPERLYHITASEFSVFKPGGNDPRLSGRVIYLTPYPHNIPAGHNTSGNIGGYRQGTSVMPVYASIQRPLYIFDADDAQYAERFKFDSFAFPRSVSDKSLAALKEAGYDGIVYAGWREAERFDLRTGRNVEIIAFEPTQVKSAIGNRGTFDPTDPDIRHNPLRIDVQYKPEEVALYQTSRAVRSVVSPALQRRNVERMIDTPHNFIVVLETRQGEEPPAPSPGAVTLGIRVPRVADDDNYDPKFEKQFSEGIYTAFTYLHKLGDILTDKICGDDESRLPLLYPSDRPRDVLFKPFYRMVDNHLGFLEAYHGDDREKAYYAYTRLIGESVNSKMVREGYSLDWMQAFADIFALCELTPASRPLLLPIEDPKSRSAPSRQWRPALPEQDVFVFNTFIVADFNKRFRAFYNTLIPSLYGRTFWLV
jgi:hypothetical protein